MAVVFEKLVAAARPLMEYLQQHHPHVTAIVTTNTTELVETLYHTGKIKPIGEDETEGPTG